MGKATERIERKDYFALGSNKSLRNEKRELLGEREKEKREKVFVCWLFRGLSTPANEKLLSIFHHTQESFRYSLKVVCVV